MRRVVLCVLVALGLGGPRPVLGQRIDPAAGRTLAWLTFAAGGGAASGTGFASAAAIEVLTHGHLLSVRASGIAVAFDDSFWDAGVLYGRTHRFAWGLASASAGVAIVDGERCRGSFGGRCAQLRARIGLPVSARATWTPSRFLGLGIAALGNINGEQSFGGLVLAIQVGRLR